MSQSPPTTDRWGILLSEFLLLIIFCFVYAGGRAPDVNEAHYLTKAKHFWDPAWCQGDFYLESADAHLPFFWTVGVLTRWIDLVPAAWVGRALAWTAIAMSWMWLFRGYIRRAGWSALAGCAVTLLWDHGHLAGEWVVGGCEAKVFAYALVFGALASARANRWNLALVLLGSATALHVLVGGWSTMLLTVCWLIEPRDQRPSLADLSPGVLLWVALGSTGLWPAIALSGGTDSETLRLANEIYVFDRLPHHLVLHEMKGWNIGRFAVLLVVWLWGSRVADWQPRERIVRNFIDLTLVLAFVGLLLDLISFSSPDLAARALRFYWFRLADVFVPIGVVLIGSKWLSAAEHHRPATARWCLVGLLVVAGALVGGRWTARRGDPRPAADDQGQPVWSDDRQTQIGIWHAWRDVCGWVRDRTARDAQFLTPLRNQTFLWYAQRPEFVCWKNIPQDAAGIVEWHRRVEAIAGVGLYRDGDSFSPAAVRELIREYDLDYIIATPTVQPVSCDLPIVYENRYFRIYEGCRSRIVTPS